MEGLDIERRDLPDVRVALDPERAGHEREVDAPRIDARELRLCARLLDDLHLGAERRDLARPTPHAPHSLRSRGADRGDRKSHVERLTHLDAPREGSSVYGVA